MFMHNSGVSRREIAEVYLDVIACDKREAFAQGSPRQPTAGGNAFVGAGEK
jgi:hypothetical protein